MTRPAHPGGTTSLSDKAKASDLFIDCLENEGVEYIFGVPGEENLDFLDSPVINLNDLPVGDLPFAAPSDWRNRLPSRARPAG